MVSPLPVSPAWTTYVSNTMKIDLGDAETHTVRVMVAGAAIGQIWTGPNGVIVAPQHASGESASTIANTLGVSRATVYRVLAEQAD